MSREQAQEFLVKLYEQMLIRETSYKFLLKHRWGLVPEEPETPKKRFGFTLFGWWIGIQWVGKPKTVVFPIALVKVDPGSLV